MQLQILPLTYVSGSPHFDGPVLRGGVQEPLPSPLDTGHRVQVATEHEGTAAQVSVPHTNSAVLGRAGQVPTLALSEWRVRNHNVKCFKQHHTGVLAATSSLSLSR